ncbi:MAG TPA: transcriptional regulator [Cytophagales bacterium]|jgi:transcriptional regulator with XRE-family HTH domain|nr:transcriptional regulator [Cytophagales bacterium]
MPNAELSNAFAAVVKRRRLAKGFSKAVLAERAGLHQTYVGLLESGKSNPTLDTANMLAKALGVSLEKMITEAQSTSRSGEKN